MIQIYHGDGKGKTTAALGLLTRATGAELPTAVVFFDKGGEEYSERTALKKLGVRIVTTGIDRRDKKTWKFRFGVTSRDKREAMRGLREAKKLIESKKYTLIVLDEILNCLRLKMLPLKSVIATINQAKKQKIELILTGRCLPAELEKLADLVTEMREVKHYFKSGTMARQGIEY